MTSARGIGLVVGLSVGAGFAALQQAISFGELVGYADLPWTAPTIVSGGLVGWLFGSMAWRARGTVAWSGIAFGQALLAVVIGALAIAVEGFLIRGLLESGDLADLPFALLGTLLLTIWGLALLGWAVAPLAFGAAVTWSVAMAAIRRIT